MWHGFRYPVALKEDLALVFSQNNARNRNFLGKRKTILLILSTTQLVMAETFKSTRAQMGLPVVCLTLQITFGQHQNTFCCSETDTMPLFRQSWEKIMPLCLFPFTNLHTGKLSTQGKHQKSISGMQHLFHTKYSVTQTTSCQQQVADVSFCLDLE